MSACRRATSKSVDCFIPRSEPIVSLLEKIDYLLSPLFLIRPFDALNPQAAGERVNAYQVGPESERPNGISTKKGRHPKDAVNLQDMARDLTGVEPLPEIITQKSGERVHILSSRCLLWRKGRRVHISGPARCGEVYSGRLACGNFVGG
jgi:hypothetical protein